MIFSSARFAPDQDVKTQSGLSGNDPEGGVAEVPVVSWHVGRAGAGFDVVNFARWAAHKKQAAGRVHHIAVLAWMPKQIRSNRVGTLQTDVLLSLAWQKVASGRDESKEIIGCRPIGA